jgi:hypothetical protein
MNFNIRFAQNDDAEHLADLNSRWQGVQMNDDAKKKNGFLSASFSEDDFIILISHQEVVVATFRNKIIGYYLINNYVDSDKFRQGKFIVQQLMNERKIPSECKVGLGAQVLIEVDYRGNNLSNKMLFLLCEIANKKYDYLYSSINKKNVKSINSNLRNGWKILDENESLFFVFLQPKVYLLNSKNVET